MIRGKPRTPSAKRPKSNARVLKATRRGAPIGNRYGAKNKRWKEALNSCLDADPKTLLRIARQFLAAAEAGDMEAIRELGNRLDGRPTVQLDEGGDAGLKSTFAAVVATFDAIHGGGE